MYFTDVKIIILKILFYERGVERKQTSNINITFKILMEINKLKLSFSSRCIKIYVYNLREM